MLYQTLYITLFLFIVKLAVECEYNQPIFFITFNLFVWLPLNAHPFSLHVHPHFTTYTPLGLEAGVEVEAEVEEIEGVKLGLSFYRSVDKRLQTTKTSKWCFKFAQA